jgi:cysteinyl-tRNA synthetase
VYFEVAKYSGYGRLSKRKLEDLQAGARVDVDERKRSPMDFALWKSSKPGEPSWESPWGPGRPGWHIECSAMSIKYLGETFDIHGGGMDLIFPHHENEIAQSCGATGKEFARYWIHNGFVQINQEKMSKSLGNFFTIREIFEKSVWSVEVTGEILRYFLLSTQYRGPLDFSDQSLKEAKNALNGFYDLFTRLAENGQGSTETDQDLQVDAGFMRGTVSRGMDDDLNTPVVLAEFQRLKSEVNKLLSQGLSTEARKSAREEFRSLGNVLGLFQLEPDRWQFAEPLPSGQFVTAMQEARQQYNRPSDSSVWSPVQGDSISDEKIEQMKTDRDEARKQKNFKKADEIRQFLKSYGVVIEDKPDGTSRWKR